jgi:hypothetical protein
VEVAVVEIEVGNVAAVIALVEVVAYLAAEVIGVARSHENSH